MDKYVAFNLVSCPVIDYLCSLSRNTVTNQTSNFNSGLGHMVERSKYGGKE